MVSVIHTRQHNESKPCAIVHVPVLCPARTRDFPLGRICCLWPVSHKYSRDWPPDRPYYGFTIVFYVYVCMCRRKILQKIYYSNTII